MAGRNDPCPCGSGKKYKKCCLGQEPYGPDDPRSKCFCRLLYSYHPKKEAWLHQALERSPNFRTDDREVYLYPAEGDVKVQLPLGEGNLEAIMFADHRAEVEQALEEAAGPLVRKESTERVFLFDHFLAHGLDAPIVPGMISLGQLYPSVQERPHDQAAALLEALQLTHINLGSTEPGPPSLTEVLDEFLNERCQAVGQATLTRDEKALNLLQTFLVLEKLEHSSARTPEEFLEGLPYPEMVQALPRFEEFLERSPLVRNETMRKGVKTSLGVFLNWLVDRGLLIRHDPSDFEEPIPAAVAEAHTQGALTPVDPSRPQTLLFRLTLVDSAPPVWRDLRIPGRYRLDQVHKMMQILFGWEDCHLHNFQFGTELYTDLETVYPEFDLGEKDERLSLAEALGPHRTFLYKYDFGDSWEVEARLLEVVPGDSDAPECVAGALAGPPEDCGGIPGFQELKEILANPKHPEYPEMKTWAPPGYSPLKFSATSASKKLARLFGRKAPSPKAPEEATLAGFRLRKLNVLAALVAALLEREPRTLEEIEQRLEGLGYPLKAGVESLRRAIAQADYVRTRLDGALELVQGPNLDQAVRWMGYKSQEGLPEAARLRQEQISDSSETPEDQLAKLRALSKAVVSAHWDPAAFGLALFEADSGQVRWFDQPEQARQALAEMDVIIGLDPLTGVELMGWSRPEALWVDLTPKFKSIPDRGGRRRPLSTAQAIKMVTGTKTADPAKIAAWAARGQRAKLRSLLEGDLELLRAYWRYGVIHGAVLRGHDWQTVGWNVTRELTLTPALLWCIEDGTSLFLTLRDGRTGTFHPQELLWKHDYGQETRVQGLWLDPDHPQLLPLHIITNFHYPHPIPKERTPELFW